MKVLYLFNTAGVFTPVAEHILNNGGDVKIIERYKQDIYRFTQDSRAGVMVNSAKDFYLKSINLILKFRPNIIHISSSVKVLAIARALAWRIPIVFTYHGSDVRNPSGKPHKEVVQLADYITVTTPDLSKYGNYIERPIDTKFYYRGNREAGTALMFYKNHFYKDKRDMARQWANERGIRLTILDENNPAFPIPYHEMPEFLSRFEYYLDWKDQKGDLFALSKTALEALACGCKVIHDSDVNHEIIPEKFNDCGVTPYIELYETLTKASKRKTLKRLLSTFRAMILFKRLKRYGEIYGDSIGNEQR